jgi:hypothetical protein
LSLERLDSAAAARSYFGYALDLERQRDALPALGDGPTLRVVESKSTSVRLPELEEAARLDKRVEFGARTLPITTVCGRAGDFLLQLSWYGTTADMDWAGRVTQKIPLQQ